MASSSTTPSTNYSKTFTWEGLGTLTYVFEQPGLYAASIQMTLPEDSEVVIEGFFNGTPFGTGAAGATGFQASGLAEIGIVSPGDVLTFTFSSSAPQDQFKNVVKATMSLFGGL